MFYTIKVILAKFQPLVQIFATCHVLGCLVIKFLGPSSTVIKIARELIRAYTRASIQIMSFTLKLHLLRNIWWSKVSQHILKMLLTITKLMLQSKDTPAAGAFVRDLYIWEERIGKDPQELQYESYSNVGLLTLRSTG